MDWTNNVIRFEKLPQRQFLIFDWKQQKPAEVDFSRVRYLIIWYHKSRDRTLDNLPTKSPLLYLEMNWSNTHSFIGIDRFAGLKRLEMHYCTKLHRAEGIESLRDSIEILHINQSRRLLLSRNYWS